MNVKLVDTICGHYMISVLILEDIEKIKLLLIVIWSICAFMDVRRNLIDISNTYSRGDVYSGSSSH